ncbi:MAG: type II toxin-antitoxin system HicB family antitoxin [Streptosporangiaceae bacterium]
MDAAVKAAKVVVATCMLCGATIARLHRRRPPRPVPYGVACKTATGNPRPVARQNRYGFSSEIYRAVTVLYLSQVVDLCQPPHHDQETVAMSARVRTVHVPYTLEQDEDGVWCASAQLRLGVGAVGDGETREAALDDLREALQALIAEVGIPDELTLTLNVA